MRPIDGDALRDKLHNLGYDDWNQGVTTTWAEAFNECADMVDETPAIEPEPHSGRRVYQAGYADGFEAGRKAGAHWIPCSERLPEEETDVLVTRKFLGCRDGSHGWNAHIPPKTYVEVAQYCNGEWIALSDEYKVARSRHTDPVAWMPRPEPYLEGQE
jgi:hypothetical protein